MRSLGPGIAACGLPDDQCREQSAVLRKKLKRGWWKEVVCTLLEHGSGLPEGSSFWTEIAYLQSKRSICPFDDQPCNRVKVAGGGRR